MCMYQSTSSVLLTGGLEPLKLTSNVKYLYIGLLCEAASSSTLLVRVLIHVLRTVLARDEASVLCLVSVFRRTHTCWPAAHSASPATRLGSWCSPSRRYFSPVRLLQKCTFLCKFALLRSAHSCLNSVLYSVYWTQLAHSSCRRSSCCTSTCACRTSASRSLPPHCSRTRALCASGISSCAPCARLCNERY